MPNLIVGLGMTGGLLATLWLCEHRREQLMLRFTRQTWLKKPFTVKNKLKIIIGFYQIVRLASAHDLQLANQQLHVKLCDRYVPCALAGDTGGGDVRFPVTTAS